MSEDIYLDNHATTACAPEVVEAMIPYLSEFYGNASSAHSSGLSAAHAVKTARRYVSELIGAKEEEIYFTSGATESNNLAIVGTAKRHARSGGTRSRLISTNIEHKSVYEPLRHLATSRWEHIELPVNEVGQICLRELEEVADASTFLVSVQAANSEIGTIQPIKEVAALAKRQHAIVHCDASQMIGKVSFSVEDYEIDLVSMSAHKLHGPKGIGALWVRGGASSFPIDPIFRGGNQECGIRPGTLAVPLIVGFGEAARLTRIQLEQNSKKVRALRDYFERGLLSHLGHRIVLNGDLNNRLPNNSNITFPNIEAEMIFANLPWLIASTGSACESG